MVERVFGRRPFVNSRLWPGAASPGSGRLLNLGACKGHSLELTHDKDTACAPAHLVRPSTRWETIMGSAANAIHREPWNKGKIVGQKAPFKLEDI
jgi:hypothetical protein